MLPRLVFCFPTLNDKSSGRFRVYVLAAAARGVAGLSSWLIDRSSSFKFYKIWIAVESPTALLVELLISSEAWSL